ncbi:MAG: hypothetical protein RI897_3435 [Verrucomicrobiota bacterium]|jgi:predicted nuclease of predicted toxin-antitoxin system
MRILFDQGTPVPLRRHLCPHVVDTAAELGWSTLQNGDLLAQAEAAGYKLLLTKDQHLRHQQRLEGRKIGLVVLMTTSWPKIQKQVARVQQVVSDLPGGGYAEVSL